MVIDQKETTMQEVTRKLTKVCFDHKRLILVSIYYALVGGARRRHTVVVVCVIPQDTVRIFSAIAGHQGLKCAMQA